MNKAAVITIDQEKILHLLRTDVSVSMEMIYDQFAPVLYGFAFRIVKDEAMAEDILMETFVHISRHHDDFDEAKQNFVLWMISIVRMFATKRAPFLKFIKNRNAADYVSTDGMSARSVDNSFTRPTSAKSSGMSYDEREVLDLVFFGGGKINEVAIHLGTDENKVKQLLREALNHYRMEKQEVAWK